MTTSTVSRFTKPELASRYEALLRMARGTRAAQRDYFRTRSQSALQVARDWERRLDRLLDEQERTTTQPELWP